MRVWQVAQSSDSRMWAACSCSNPVTECMMRRRPVSMASGPKARRVPLASGAATTKFPLKLSRVPSRSAEIWWQTVHETPSRARLSSAVSAPAASAERCEKTCAFPTGRVRDLLGRREMAGCALVFDIRGTGLVIGRLPPDAGLDVGIARRIRHHCCAPARTDRHVLTFRRHEAVVACEAITRVSEHRGVRLRVFLDRSTGARRPERCPPLLSRTGQRTATSMPRGS